MTTDYSSANLCFKANIIEHLSDEDTFVIHTQNGSFRFTKAQFYQIFSNVVKSDSYKVRGIYCYSKTPQKAMPYLISGELADKPRKSKKVTEDLVGNDIRTKIKEIAKIWQNSKEYCLVKTSTLEGWNKVIEEWINDNDMPLIVRKETNKRGHIFTHCHNGHERKIIIADNSLAIWIYGKARENKVCTLDDIKVLIKEKKLPVMFMCPKDTKDNVEYPVALSGNPLSGLKLCHIKAVGFNTHKSILDLDIKDIENHFRRYANPNNMFVLPKEIGYLGEIDVFIDELTSNLELTME